uniref:Uncharacterized protein n=1 Tax=Manihot esculenta TaxID=3983 RepID=A0A2C9V9H0_MANES
MRILHTDAPRSEEEEAGRCWPARSSQEREKMVGSQFERRKVVRRWRGC